MFRLYRKMPLTNAEKQRRFRAKLKASGQYDAYKQQHRDEVRKSRAKMNEEERNLPELVQQQIKEAKKESTKKRVAAWRKAQKEKAEAAKVTPSPYGSAQAFAKATTRARRMLPQTPNRRKAVCRNLYNSECSIDVPSTSTQEACDHARYSSLSLAQETRDLILQFYERDDISHQAPGRKDVITVRSKEGNKMKMQVRNITSSIMPYSPRNILIVRLAKVNLQN